MYDVRALPLLPTPHPTLVRDDFSIVETMPRIINTPFSSVGSSIFTVENDGERWIFSCILYSARSSRR